MKWALVPKRATLSAAKGPAVSPLVRPDKGHARQSKVESKRPVLLSFVRRTKTAKTSRLSRATRSNQEMHPDFSMPSPGSIKGRASSITAAFVQAIVPAIEPTEREVDEALTVLGMRRGECRCAYCGDSTTEWDHFRPLVAAQRPTGYITEIANLVPACGKCNQSKGNKSWKVWIRSNVRRSPAFRQVPDLEGKIRRLEEFERWRTPTKIDFEAEVGSEFWHIHWENLARFFSLMDECEIHARALRKRIEENRSNRITRSANLA